MELPVVHEPSSLSCPQKKGNGGLVVMIANHSSPMLHWMAGKHPGRIGWLVGPTARKKTKLRKWIPYALDNDAFSAWTNKTEWDEKEWRALLEWAKMSGQKPQWILVPDEVANKQKTLEKWSRYSDEVEETYKRPLAFAVQDGMTPDDVPRNAEVIFIGGTTEWKWKNVPVFTKNFPRVHVGRVNELRRLRTCVEYNVESCDGTGWIRDPSNPKKLELLDDFLSGNLNDQQLELDQ